MIEKIFVCNMLRLSSGEILKISGRREFLSEENQMEIRTDKELVGSDPSLNEENQVNICFI